MTNSIVKRLYGEQLKHSRFLVLVENLLVFTVKLDTPVNQEEFLSRLNQDFGEEGKPVFNIQAATLSNDLKAKDMVFCSDNPLKFEVIPIE